MHAYKNVRVASNFQLIDKTHAPILILKHTNNSKVKQIYIIRLCKCSSTRLDFLLISKKEGPMVHTQKYIIHLSKYAFCTT